MINRESIIEEEEEEEETENVLKRNSFIIISQKTLSKKMRWLILIILSLIHSYLGISSGIFSSSVTAIKSDLKLSDSQFGTIGTFYGFGTLLGSFIFTFLNDKTNRKCYFLFSMSLNTCLNLFFFFVDSFYIIILIRTLSGVFVVCGYCFFPIWIEQFGIKKHKTCMFTTMNLFGNIGMIWGYFINLFISSEEWRFGLVIEIIIIMSHVLFLCCIPNMYFDKYLILDESDKKNEDIFIYKKDFFNLEMSFSTSEKSESENEKEDNKENTIPKIKDNKIQNERIKIKEKISKNNLFIKYILCNILFICVSLFKANTYFISTAQNYWYSDYLQNTLKIESSKEIFISYSISQVASGIIGMFLGGLILSYIGGYRSKKSMLVMIITQFISSIFGIISPYLNNLTLFTIFTSIYVIFTSIPSLISSGYCLKIVPKNMTGNANGFFIFIVNLIGMLPAPFIYAYIKEVFNDGRSAMKFLGYYSLFGLFTLVIGEFFRRKLKR